MPPVGLDPVRMLRRAATEGFFGLLRQSKQGHLNFILRPAFVRHV